MGSETFGNQLLVFETKGGYLQDNPDTAYKQRVFKTLEKAFNDGFDAGQVTVKHGPCLKEFSGWCSAKRSSRRRWEASARPDRLPATALRIVEPSVS